MSIYDRVPLDIDALDRLFDIRDKALDVKKELVDFTSDDPVKMQTKSDGLKSVQTIMKMVDYVYNYRLCYVGFEADLVKIRTCLSDAEYYLSFIARWKEAQPPKTSPPVEGEEGQKEEDEKEGEQEEKKEENGEKEEKVDQAE